MIIEIDNSSGFCFGVTTAIQKAEDTLKEGQELSCLGDIVHNGMECERLRKMGLATIEHEEFEQLHDATVLLRAHGEPPATYETARKNNINIIDATCPVVLTLQKRIKKQYESTKLNTSDRKSDIVIFGKNGHAEVLGLVGQTEGNAIVIEHAEDARKLDFSHNIFLYSQTTKSWWSFIKLLSIASSISRLMPRFNLSTRSADKWLTVCLISASLLRSTTSFSSFVGARAVMVRCCIMRVRR